MSDTPLTPVDLRDLAAPAVPAPVVRHPGVTAGAKRRPEDGDKPTPQELRFVAEYLLDQDGPRAVQAAGYRSRTADGRRVLAAKLLARPRIANLIQARMDRILATEDVTVEKVVRELARIGYADPADLYEPEGPQKLRDIRQMPERVRRAISSVKVRVEKDEAGDHHQTIEVKFWPKLGALDSLAARLEALLNKFGGGAVTGMPGAGPVQDFRGSNVVMYFPDNGRGPTGPNPTNRTAALTYKAPAVDPDELGAVED